MKFSGRSETSAGQRSDMTENTTFKPIHSLRSGTRPYCRDRTEQWTLLAASGRLFEISVSLPKAPAPIAGFPVLYVLDPSTAFATLADVVRNHERMFGPAIVVGIGYSTEAEIANRAFDMSPPTDRDTLPNCLPNGWGAVGGADVFLDFLLSELRPKLAELFAIDPVRQALLGHSLGGLFALHALFTRSSAFDTYVAASPSIWWGNKVILKSLPAFKAEQMKRTGQRKLLVVLGEREDELTPEESRAAAAMNLINIKLLLDEAKMRDNATALMAELRPLQSYGLQSAYVEFPQETHNSVIPAYLSRGARFALQGWYG